MQQLLLLSLLIFKKLAVNYADYPACTFGNVQVVGYHDYGMTLLVKLAEKLQNFLVALSRAPVGSSARSSFGLPTSALAMAALCC